MLHAGTWELRDGAADPDQWLRAAYRDCSLVTQVGARHADHAEPPDTPAGLPTSCATAAGLIVQMLRHARITDDAEILEVGTGSGYGCAVLCERAGYRQVTSIDVDDYLARAAAARLDGIGLHPRVLTCDATGPLPGSYDRIVSATAVRPVPASWLAGLRPGGRLVTTIAGTRLVVTADKAADGGATGRAELDQADFMAARCGPGYPGDLLAQLAASRDTAGEDVRAGRYPVVNVAAAADLYSAIGLSVPGIQHQFSESADGARTAWMAHPDGSWARATSSGQDAPVVHQSGPRRLWDSLDDIRSAWLRDGYLPAHGAQVAISADGTVVLTRGNWQVTLTAAG